MKEISAGGVVQVDSTLGPEGTDVGGEEWGEHSAGGWQGLV